VAGSEARLRPVFRTEVTRTQHILSPAAGATVELALDDGIVVSNGRSEPLSELEIELKRGPEEVLYRLGLDLLHAAPLSLLVESKAERGYRLHDGSRPAAAKAPPIVLDRDIRLYAAFRQIADSALGHLLANQPAALHGEEDEGIHQMRVAVRRLRSLLALFQPFLEPHTAGRFAMNCAASARCSARRATGTSSLPGPCHRRSRTARSSTGSNRCAQPRSSVSTPPIRLPKRRAEAAFSRSCWPSRRSAAAAMPSWRIA